MELSFEDKFFVRSGEADLPVEVRGNVDSDICILLVPGWPGLGLVYAAEEAFQNLESEYKMVYWNLRGAGSSRGNPSLESYTLSRQAQDLGLVVESLKHRYGNQKIYLLGHSFGGFIAAEYMAGEGSTQNITGFIAMETILKRKMFIEWTRDRVLEYALGMKGDPYWDSAYTELLNTPADEKAENIDRIFSYAGEASIFEKIDYSPFYMNILAETFKGNCGNMEVLITQFGGYARFYKEIHIDFERLSEIFLPTLIIHGIPEKKGFGRDAALTIHDELGTPINQKKYVIFDKSGHLPYVTEPKRLVSEINSFIRQINTE